MNSVNLDRLTKEETMSVAIALLYSLKDDPKYSMISELPYIIDYDSFIKLIKYYGGMTIKIPTIEEINDILRILLLYQNFKVKKMDWKESLSLSGYTEDEGKLAQGKLAHFSKLLKKQEIGNRDYD